jgi:hypothetical protein
MLQFTCKWPGRDPPAAGRRWKIAGQWLPPLPGTSYPVTELTAAAVRLPLLTEQACPNACSAQSPGMSEVAIYRA